MASFTSACLQVSGSISVTGNDVHASTVDNGVVTCNSDWGWHEDGGFIYLGCLPNYRYSFRADPPDIGYYNNPSNGFTFSQNWGGSHQSYYWQLSLYGC